MEFIKFNVPPFIHDFLLSLKEKGRKEGTIIRYGYYIEEFCEWLQKAKKAEVTFDLWKELTNEDYMVYYKEELIQKRQYGKNSLKRIESVLNQLYSFYKQQYPEIKSPAFHVNEAIWTNRELTQRDVFKRQDFERLVTIMGSEEGLTENQLKGRGMLVNRNILIVTLFYKYGLTLSELVNLRMKDLNLGLNFENRKFIRVRNQKDSGSVREVELADEDAKVIASYLDDIPAAVRPKYGSTHPLFVAFDFQRLTYRWVYDNDDRLNNGHPKALSNLAIQKMIREESKRAGLLYGATAQQMRNAAIIQSILHGETDKTIIQKYGLMTEKALEKHKKYAEILNLRLRNI